MPASNWPASNGHNSQCCVAVFTCLRIVSLTQDMTVILPAGRVYALAHHKLMPTSCWGQRLRAFTTCRHALYANSSSSFRSRIVENVGGFLRPPLIPRPFFFYFRFSSSSPPQLRLITPPLFSSAVLYAPNVPTLLFVATCKTRTNRPSSAISSPNTISLFFSSYLVLCQIVDDAREDGLPT